jgi:hypothetical protein
MAVCRSTLDVVTKGQAGCRSRKLPASSRSPSGAVLTASQVGKRCLRDLKARTELVSVVFCDSMVRTCMAAEGMSGMPGTLRCLSDSCDNFVRRETFAC